MTVSSMENAASPIFVAIDLGSNSFHMWVVRQVAGSVQTLAKIKRKVRLAAGLDKNNRLSLEAMQRGWDCLALFAERLQDIDRANIRVVATAAIRSAVNRDEFLARGGEILGFPIQVIPGEEEARIIYQGVAHTSGGSGKRLVVDIGGASTEVIIGEGFDAAALTSLKMGCVTWLDGYFHDRVLNNANFSAAIDGAKAELAPILAHYKALGWDVCVGASGTVQALQEIMLAQGMDEVITLAKLNRLKKQAISFGQLEELDIDGLTLERALVFPSGLAILIAIFESFGIESMTLAGGALREGLVYELMAGMREDDVCQRTLASLETRYQIDSAHGRAVADMAEELLNQCGTGWVTEPQGKCMLQSAARLHEIGISIGFKKGGEHAAYLLCNIDLPGFTRAQAKLLAELVSHYRDGFTAIEGKQALSSVSAVRLLRLLRLAVILCHRRDVSVQPEIALSTTGDSIKLTLAGGLLGHSPLLAAELELEANRQTDAGYPLTICG